MHTTHFKAKKTLLVREVELITKRVRKVDGVYAVKFNEDRTILMVAHRIEKSLPNKIRNSVIAIGYSLEL